MPVFVITFTYNLLLFVFDGPTVKKIPIGLPRFGEDIRAQWSFSSGGFRAF